MVVYMFNMFIVQRLNKYLQIQDCLEYISRDYLHSQHFENVEPLVSTRVGRTVIRPDKPDIVRTKNIWLTNDDEAVEAF